MIDILRVALRVEARSIGPYSGEVDPLDGDLHFAPAPRRVVVVPLRSFDSAKSRLRAAGTSNVASIAEQLARAVLASCKPLPVVVVCETDDIERFAVANGAAVLRSPHTGLNAAVTFAYEHLAHDYHRLAIAHGDLRFPDGLGRFEPTAAVTIVADRHGTGTNVLSLPTGLPFRFHYGPGSARRHAREAERLGLEVVTITDSPWRFDVDVPEDLTAIEANGGPTAPHSLGTAL